MGETFVRLADAKFIDVDLSKRVRNAVGFRNIAVHNYDVIDWSIVHALSDLSLRDFEDFARQIAKQMPK
ncbi:MAG TPA: HepT-like ribonuclease domain-containing protein [Ideonella sp.]|nr:HepT-like ribonuclease domain-containing protein [Ideonella sp.]